MPAVLVDLNTIAAAVPIPRSTLDCWARRDHWQSTTNSRGLKCYPAKLIAARIATWQARPKQAI